MQPERTRVNQERSKGVKHKTKALRWSRWNWAEICVEETEFGQLYAGSEEQDPWEVEKGED